MPNSILYGPNSQPFETHTVQQFDLGTQLHLLDGRRFRYVKAGGTALVAGDCIQSEVPDADHDTLATAVNGAVGDKFVTVTNGADAIEEDLYAEGYVIMEQIATNAGGGRMYKIAASHDAIAASVSGQVPLVGGNGVQEAFVAGTGTATLVKSPYDDVIQQPGPPTACVVGIAVSDIPAANWGWLQTHGPAACHLVGTAVIGGSISPTGTVTGTAGAVEATGVLITTTAPTIAQMTEILRIGICMEVAPTGDACAVFLLID